LDKNAINANFFENLFEFDISSENKINILGNLEKNHYVKGNNEIFIEFYLNLPEEEQSIFGIKILRKGKIFVGRFNEFGLLNGDGVYISKKGDLLIGEFFNNDVNKATIYCYKGQTYEGTVKNLKKDGYMQMEVSQKYEFVGDFENGKKIQGIYYPKYDHDIELNLNSNLNIMNYNLSDNNKNNTLKIKIRCIEINKDNLNILKKAIKEKKLNYNQNDNDFNNFHYLKFNKETFIAKIIFEYDGKHLIYTGCINENKLNDLNALLQFDLINKFPLFHGSIKNNQKDGKCKYYNNERESFSGSFSGGKFYSDVEKEFQEMKESVKEQIIKKNEEANIKNVTNNFSKGFAGLIAKTINKNVKNNVTYKKNNYNNPDGNINIEMNNVIDKN